MGIECGKCKYYTFIETSHEWIEPFCGKKQMLIEKISECENAIVTKQPITKKGSTTNIDWVKSRNDYESNLYQR